MMEPFDPGCMKKKMKPGKKIEEKMGAKGTQGIGELQEDNLRLRSESKMLEFNISQVESSSGCQGLGCRCPLHFFLCELSLACLLYLFKVVEDPLTGEIWWWESMTRSHRNEYEVKADFFSRVRNPGA